MNHGNFAHPLVYICVRRTFLAVFVPFRNVFSKHFGIPVEEKTSSRILDLTISGRNYSEASPREMNFVGEI